MSFSFFPRTLLYLLYWTDRMYTKQKKIQEELGYFFIHRFFTQWDVVWRRSNPKMHCSAYFTVIGDLLSQCWVGCGGEGVGTVARTTSWVAGYRHCSRMPTPWEVGFLGMDWGTNTGQVHSPLPDILKIVFISWSKFRIFQTLKLRKEFSVCLDLYSVN